MSQEPIILSGGDRMVTIQLPSLFKMDATKGKKFSISLVPETESFKSIVITDTKTGKPIFTLDIKAKQWQIEIK
jgi:hypothetical protein